MADVITKIDATKFRIVKEDSQVHDIADIKNHIVALEAQKAKAIVQYDDAIARFMALLDKAKTVGVEESIK